jgi:protease-4
MFFGPPPPRRGAFWVRIGTGVITSLFFLSILLNIYLGAYFISALSGPSEKPYIAGDTQHRIVILDIDGLIDGSTAKYIHDSLKELRDNKPAAIILRVDSGGGTVSSSDLIAHEIEQFRADTKVPVVASFGGIAASGAYYVSAQSDYIVAEPTCITGSIGVIAELATFDRLLDKIGVTPEVIVATGSQKKDIANNLMRPWDERDRDKVRMILDHAYSRFVDVVWNGRKKHFGSRDEVKALATGDIFTPDQAVANKLIDKIGYLDEAITQAKALAQLGPKANPEVTRMRQKQGVSISVSSASQLDVAQLRNAMGSLAAPRIEYRWIAR